MSGNKWHFKKMVSVVTQIRYWLNSYAGLHIFPLAMLVHRRVTLQEYVAGTHLYTWVKREKVE